ncbi:hypothetical protein AB0K09_23560, partial [Streptomyces sp. NPDC049577]
MTGRSAVAHPRRRGRRLPALLTEERPRPERIRARPGAWRLAVGTVCLGAFLGQLDASIVTLTYGGLRSEFHASLAAVEWVSLAYLLTLGPAPGRPTCRAPAEGHPAGGEPACRARRRP